MNARIAYENTVAVIEQTAIYKKIIKALNEGIDAASRQGRFTTQIKVSFDISELSDPEQRDYSEISNIADYITSLYCSSKCFSIDYAFDKNDTTFVYAFDISWFSVNENYASEALNILSTYRNASLTTNVNVYADEYLDALEKCLKGCCNKIH